MKATWWWNGLTYQGTDNYGFAARGGGILDYYGYDWGFEIGMWWSKTVSSDPSWNNFGANCLTMTNRHYTAFIEPHLRPSGVSVRCIKD